MVETGKGDGGCDVGATDGVTHMGAVAGVAGGALPGQVVEGAVMADGVPMSVAGAAQTLQFVNTASIADLKRAGVYRKGVDIIVAQRPFASMEAFADTYGIGPGTVKSVVGAAR